MLEVILLIKTEQNAKDFHLFVGLDCSTLHVNVVLCAKPPVWAKEYLVAEMWRVDGEGW